MTISSETVAGERRFGSPSVENKAVTLPRLANMIGLRGQELSVHSQLRVKPSHYLGCLL